MAKDPRQPPGPDAEQWEVYHTTSGPWYDDELADYIFYRPSHLGEDSDPWKLNSIERAPPVERIPLGKELPPIKRSKRCPGQMAVPEVISKAYDQSTLLKKPKIYVLAFPGMGDAVNAGWVKHEMETPEHFEWATFEWPGHGERLHEISEEKPRTYCIADLGADAFDTFREAMSIGSFILVGHSIGCLIMTYVAIRAERELGVQPLCCFALDRTAPHQRVYSPYSDWMARYDVMNWIAIRNPSIHHAALNNQPGWEDTLDMWSKDECVQTDAILPEFYNYKYPCKVYVMISMLELTRIKLNEMVDPWRTERRRHFVNGKGFNYELHEFDEWVKWGDYIDVRKVEVDHKGLVSHNRFLTLLYKEVTQHLKKGEAALKKGGKTGAKKV